MRIMLAAVTLTGLLACKPSDPKNPETWIARLTDSDARERVRAVQGLRKLKARDAAPQIVPLLRDAQVREDAALALQDLGGPAEVQPLLDAIDTTVGAGSAQATRSANRTNAKIADALGAIGDPKAGPALLRLARSKDDLVRLSAVQALGLVHAKEAVPELSRMVDDESLPPLLIKKAIVSLGQLGDPAAIPALEHGLVIERQGVSFLPESSFALFLLGSAAVDPLLKLLQDEDLAYSAWAKDLSRSAAGTYAKAALVLGDLGDQRAAPGLLAKLKYADPDPIPQTARLLTNLVREFSANALGRLRAKEAAAPILLLVQTKDLQDLDLVTFSTEALVEIGDRSQAKELLKRAQSGSFALRVLCAQAAAMLGDPSLSKDLAALAAREEKGSSANCQRQAAELNLPGGDSKGACAQLAEQFAQLVAPLEAARACAENVPCWTMKLNDQSVQVRTRAAYQLGRSGDAQPVPALVKAAATLDLPARVAAIRALGWLASVPAARPALKAAAPELAAQLRAEQGRLQFVRVNEELRRLQETLSRL